MAGPQVASGAVRSRQRPPGWPFLGIGAGCFALNHLCVAVGWGLVPELLVAGAWLALLGGWAQFAGRVYDAAEAWADPSDRRMMAFGLFTVAAALGIAEAVAWWGYGQHLV